MPDREDRLAESRQLATMLVRIAEQAKADLADAVAPFGLPVHLARAILALGSPAPMSELAERLACDRSYVTGLADGLEARGLVTRVPGEDRRVKLLALTPSGRVLRDEIADAVAERTIVLRRLSEAQRHVLAPLLEALLAHEPVANRRHSAERQAGDR